jgi:hypothetical protein
MGDEDGISRHTVKVLQGLNHFEAIADKVSQSPCASRIAAAAQCIAASNESGVARDQLDLTPSSIEKKAPRAASTVFFGPVNLKKYGPAGVSTTAPIKRY